MTEEEAAFSEELTADPKFEWAVGMLTASTASDNPARLVGREGDVWLAVFVGEKYVSEFKSMDGLVLDISDPGTKGCLAELARKLWGGTIWVGGRLVIHDDRPNEIRWWVCGLHISDSERVNGHDGFDTEGIALARAIRATPTS